MLTTRNRICPRFDRPDRRAVFEKDGLLLGELVTSGIRGLFRHGRTSPFCVP